MKVVIDIPNLIIEDINNVIYSNPEEFSSSKHNDNFNKFVNKAIDFALLTYAESEMDKLGRHI